MWKYKSKKREKYYNEVIRLYTEERLGCVKISRIIPVGDSTISRWISTFAAENQSPTLMPKTTPSHQAATSPDKECGDVKALQAEIARLKKQLAHESLRADAYDELINVAEKQFNISIRKKAGAKQ